MENSQLDSDIVINSESLPGKIGKTPPQEFLDIFGSWEDNRSAEEIIEDIYSSRTFSDNQESL